MLISTNKIMVIVIIIQNNILIEVRARDAIKCYSRTEIDPKRTLCGYKDK